MAFSKLFQALRLAHDVIRDFSQVFVDNAAMTVSLVTRFKVVGLDWSIYNRGLAPITIAIDGGPADTIAPAGSRWANGIKFDRIDITAADDYTLYVAGVKF